MDNVWFWVCGGILALWLFTVWVAFMWYRVANGWQRAHESQKETTLRYRRLFELQEARAKRWKHAAILQGFHDGNN